MTRLRLRAAAWGFALAVVSTPTAAQTTDTAPPKPQLGQASDVSIKVGTLELRDLGFDVPGRGRWSIGRIAFGGFSRNGSQSRAERIDIEKVVMTAGSQTVEIPSVVISGADFPVPLFRALTTGEVTGDLAALLTAATVDRIAIDRVAVRDSSTQLEITYSNFVITGLKGGRLAALHLAGTTATMGGSPGATNGIRLRSGEILYQQFDFAEMVRMFTGGGSGDAKRVLQRAVVDGIDVTTDQATFHIKRAEVADVDLRAPAQPLPHELRQPAASGKQLSPEHQKLAAAYASDILRYARVGRYSIEGISASAPDQGSFSLGAFTLTGFSKRGIDRLAITGFDLRAPGAPVRFERFEIEGIDYGALLEAALDAAASGTAPDFSPARIGQVIPRLSAIRLSKLDAVTPQGPFALSDLRFELENRSDVSRASYAVQGLKLDLRQLKADEGRDRMLALGYGELTADVRADATWQKKDRALTIQSVGFSLGEVGRLEITARLENVDIDKAIADPADAERLLGEARVGPIDIRVVNLGLAERFYADTARSAGVSPAAISAGLAAEMRAQAIALFGPLLDARSADAIATFLQTPGTIVARIRPQVGQPPLTVAELQDLAMPELMQRLSVTLEAAPK